MLLHHARRGTRTAPDGRLVPLSEQDRGQWDTGLIAEGVEILQAALAHDRLGEFQAQAAIAALHADAPSAAETDWVQIVEWYNELTRLTDSPIVRLNRAVAVGGQDRTSWDVAGRTQSPPGCEVVRHSHRHHGITEDDAMIQPMRTTVTLDSDTAALIKQRMRERGISLNARARYFFQAGIE